MRCNVRTIASLRCQKDLGDQRITVGSKASKNFLLKGLVRVIQAVVLDNKVYGCAHCQIFGQVLQSNTLRQLLSFFKIGSFAARAHCILPRNTSTCTNLRAWTVLDRDPLRFWVQLQSMRRAIRRKRRIQQPSSVWTSGTGRIDAGMPCTTVPLWQRRSAILFSCPPGYSSRYPVDCSADVINQRSVKKPAENGFCILKKDTPAFN